MSDSNQWFHRRGTLSRGPWLSVVDETLPGWQHTGLRIAELAEHGEISWDDTGIERIVIPLAGTFTVTHGTGGASATVHLAGRASVFDGPTDVAYIPASDAVTIRGAGRVAVASARTEEIHPAQYIPAADTPIELRGAGNCTRQIHNFGTPQALDAARLIVCEVITPGGNFSSYPAHKHDANVPGHETRLEEIYYFEIARSTGPADDPAGLFATYSSPAGEIDVAALVHTGDISLVPYGYHGPAAALPGCDMYYLNVMAGPDPIREWLISDDPAYAWVRDDWTDEPTDPRLPLRRDDRLRRGDQA